MSGRRAAVTNGVVNFFSVSSLEKADPRSGGCMRAYYYRYVLRIREDAQSASMIAGIALHAELADYLRTGSRHLSSLALSGLHMVPDPGVDLLVEAPIDGVVTVAGVSLIGNLDCAHARGINKGGSDVTELHDPPGTVEVIDWKWKRDGSKTEYQLQPAELVQSIQMAGYGVYASRHFKAEHVRLSHGLFFATRGKPRKVTKLHTVDAPMRTWEYVEGLGRTIQHVVQVANADLVDANIHACSKHGGCFYRSQCIAYKIAFADQSSSTLFGESLAKEIKDSMGLQHNFPPGTTGVPQPSVTIDFRAQLAAEEEKLRVQSTQTQVGVTLDFAGGWKAIEASNRGWPTLTGRAAIQRAALVGQQIPAGATLTGSGELATINIEDPQHIIQLGTELSPPQVESRAYQLTNPGSNAAPVRQAVMGNSVLPPDAPASNPALAAQPMPGWTGILASTMTPAQAVQAMQGVTFAGQQVYTGTATPPAQTLVQVLQSAHPPVAPKRRGRPPKVAPTAVGVVQTAGPAESAQLLATHADDTQDLEVYVDCVPLGEFESIHPYVEHLLGVLCDKFIPKDGLKDVRCAPRDSALGFGGWKGAVRAIVVEMPPPDGVYHVDTRGNEIMEIVADALLAVCAARNARYTRSTR